MTSNLNSDPQQDAQNGVETPGPKPSARTHIMIGSGLIAGSVALSLVGLAPRLVAGFFLAANLLHLCISDLRSFRIPNSVTLLLATSGTLSTWLFTPDQLDLHLHMAAITGAGLFLISEVYFRLRKRDGLGLGDVKLAAAGALWVGPAISQAILIAASAGLIVGLFRGATKRGTWNDPLPFGPFLAAGLLLAWVIF